MVIHLILLYIENLSKKLSNFSKRYLRKLNINMFHQVIGDDEEKIVYDKQKFCLNQEKCVCQNSIIYTNGKSTKELIKKITNEKIKLNITAIFTLGQIKKILPSIKNTETILSIFSGRIYDIGKNAEVEFKKINKYVKKYSKCKTLWASCRMPYDYFTARRSGANIITMSGGMIEKFKKFGTNPEKYSKETVIGFFNDAKKSKFKF